jgi:hypothetical protein
MSNKMRITDFCLIIGKQEDEAYPDCSLTSSEKYLPYEGTSFKNIFRYMSKVYLLHDKFSYYYRVSHRLLWQSDILKMGKSDEPL